MGGMTIGAPLEVTRSMAGLHCRDNRVTVKADGKTPAVLLLNDRTGDDWNVWVDHKPSAVLRCNYIMRGVQLPPGDHAVVFDFEPPLTGMKVSLAAEALGAALCIAFCFVRHDEEEPEPVRPGNAATGKKA